MEIQTLYGLMLHTSKDRAVQGKESFQKDAASFRKKSSSSSFIIYSGNPQESKILIILGYCLPHQLVPSIGAVQVRFLGGDAYVPRLVAASVPGRCGEWMLK